jgi:NAD(P)-dependent dehydrogenase (short-subunit alcohol dehydrogenase family)
MQVQIKNYLVIGGSRGIGLGITRRLLKNEANVLVAARSISTELRELKVNTLELDVAAENVSELTNFIPDQLHGLVYCPGTITLRPFQSLRLSDFEKDMEVNFYGAIKVLQAVIPRLKKSEEGSVVLFSTVAARTGMNFHASIAAAKAAVEGLAISLAAEYSKSKVRFNVISPSLTDTDLAKNLLSSPEKQKIAAERHPLKRFGTVDDIASMAVFLLSSESTWITGQVLSVDGGMSTLKPL